MKKVITGHDQSGKSILHIEQEQTATVSMPNFVWHEVWATHTQDRLPIDLSEAQSRDRYSEMHNVFPETGQSLFRVLDFLPADASDVAAALSDTTLTDQLPGLLEHGNMEQSNPGMHTTDSVDYGVILSGRIKLELDDNQLVELEAGDVFVQNGTRHAWRVEEPCRMAVVLIGTQRDA